MDKFLYLALAAGALLLAATIVLIIKRRCRDTGMVCIRETWMTAILGLMILVLAFAFPVLKLMDPTVAGTGDQTYWFVVGFSVICHLMGDFVLLFTCVRCVVLFEDRAVEFSLFGDQNVIYWEDIVRVEKPLMKSAYEITDRNGNVIHVGGDKKGSRQFVEFAREKVKNVSGTDLLHQVEHRLNGRHL